MTYLGFKMKTRGGGVAGEEASMECFCRRRGESCRRRGESLEEERVVGGRSQCSVDADELKGLFLGF